jgi:DNA-binding response OmpR family regulator
MGILDFIKKRHTKRVMLVEDDVPLRSFMADRLLENGLDVVETGDGMKALNLIFKHKPDCIVLDVMLPGKSGMQILEELRAKDKETPVVVLTTLSGEGGLRLEAAKHNAIFLNKADTALEIVIETVLQHTFKES